LSYPKLKETIIHILEPLNGLSNKKFKEWIENLNIENLPYEEARVLSNVIYHKDFKKLNENVRNRIIGKTKYNWTNNKSRIYSILNDLPKQMKSLNLMFWKGAAVTEIAKNWRTREMGDLDLQVKPNDLDNILNFLHKSGYWTPMGNVSWRDLTIRATPRRESWNFISKSGEILDLHWGYLDERANTNLINQIFNDAKDITIFDFEFKLPSTEWVVASSLQHGFLKGTMGDKTQSIFDFYHLYLLCNKSVLLDYAEKSGVKTEANILFDLFENKNMKALDELLNDELYFYYNPPWLRNMSKGIMERFIKRSLSVLPKKQMDYKLIKYFYFYRIWEYLLRSSKIERFHNFLFGFITKKIINSQKNIEDILTIGWQIPDGDVIWSDRADSRLILDLSGKYCTKLQFKLNSKFKISPNPIGFMYINGNFVGGYNLKENLNRDYIEMKIPFQLIGKKIEISFRPDPYVTRKEIKLRNIWQRQSIPILRGKIDEVIKFI